VANQQLAGELSRRTASRHKENRRGSCRRWATKAGQQNGQKAEQFHSISFVIWVCLRWSAQLKKKGLVQ
jgi:hypothetical protein